MYWFIDDSISTNGVAHDTNLMTWKVIPPLDFCHDLYMDQDIYKVIYNKSSVFIYLICFCYSFDRDINYTKFYAMTVEDIQQSRLDAVLSLCCS